MFLLIVHVFMLLNYMVIEEVTMIFLSLIFGFIFNESHNIAIELIP